MTAVDGGRSYVGEGTRAALEPLCAALAEADIEAAISAPPPGCGSGTCGTWLWLTVASQDLERARAAISRHWQEG